MRTTLEQSLKLNEEELKSLVSSIESKSSTNDFGGYVEQLKQTPLKSINELGIPIAVKDNINVLSWEMNCGSKILEGYISPYNATVITKLKNNGFIPLGVTNMDELAMGSTTATSIHGKTTNPHNIECVPGGSSGGSASVVASGHAIAALGSDTGGSIRQPAAFCGVVGFKPSYGHVSRYGLSAYSSSLDQIGPITQNVTDAAILYDAIKGYDELDSTSCNIELESSYDNLDKNKKYTIGIVKGYIEQCEPDLKKDIYASIDKLQSAGHTIKEIELFDTKIAISSYYIMATAEASANLARLDGVRYGYRHSNPKDLEEMYVKSRSAGFGKEVKRRIMLGTFVLSSGYYDAYYKKSKEIQKYVKSKFRETFNSCDLVLMPVAPTTAFKFDAELSPLEMYLNDIFTISVNIAGLPGMSIPIGKDSNGLPTALQLISTERDEQKIFNCGLNLEELVNYQSNINNEGDI